MIETSTNLDWYNRPTLLEVFDQINEPKRPSDKPLLGRVEPGCGCHLCTLASVLDMIRDGCIKIQKKIK
ncbi:BnaCnng69410D [Brassica napus]|uniref:(rape) hypothetical protein n=1 Tax=Brassica napus TaxID=3708 RepID=A0A078JW80_BRANA|nr:unnamed protein product [Brassica napus]CDY70700.1 BnaCnng69410D [Brassica napus]